MKSLNQLIITLMVCLFPSRHGHKVVNSLIQTINSPSNLATQVFQRQERIHLDSHP